MSEPIKGFNGKYRFLSNFYLCTVEYKGITYPHAEGAFQAAKSTDPTIREKISFLINPIDAKKLGREIPIRKDWEKVKVRIMDDILEAKFGQNTNLLEKLLETGESHLEEVNNWGDTEWGTVNGKGKNRLGFSLMRIRHKIRYG